MAKILIENKNITQDDLLTTLQRALGDRYEVGYSKYPAVKIAVKKSGWCGVAVRKIKQLPHGTEVTYNTFVPSFLVNMLFAGVVLQIVMHSAFKQIAREFEESLKDPSEITEGSAATSRSSATASVQPANPVREAGWMGATGFVAMALPSLIYGYWYFPPIATGAIATTVAAFGLSFAAPGAGSNPVRGAFVGLASGMLGMLAVAMTMGAIAWEVERWTTPFGLFQLALFAASGLVMARSQRRPNPAGLAPATASGVSA